MRHVLLTCLLALSCGLFALPQAPHLAKATGKPTYNILFIGDANADWRNPEGSFITALDRSGAEVRRNTTGFVLAGPEYLTIFDGLTGEALATTDYIPPRHPTKLNPTADEMKAERRVAERSL